jgi:stage IV sporulation protein FB
VLLAEPPRTPWDLSFALFRIPVRVHPMFWLVAVLLGMRSETAVELATWVVAVSLSILAHEFGHALAARSYGYDPRITLYTMGGLTSFGASTYGARNAGRLGQILICLAGPAAGFALAAVLYVALRIAHIDVELSFGWPHLVRIEVEELRKLAALSDFIRQMFFANIFWGLVNLLPVFPLDGGQIAREILGQINPFEGERWSLMLSFVVACLIAVTAYVQWQSIYSALFFAYLAYWSYAMLSMSSGPGRWQ